MIEYHKPASNFERYSAQMNYKVIIISSIIICFNTLICNSQIPSDDKPLTPYVLVITGNELLKGIYADGHTQYITSTLAPLGCQCVASLSVGDSEHDLIDALNFASDHSEFVIVTGGLGPTPADITRQTVSKYTGIPIEINGELLSAMADRFRTPKDQLRENLVRQTYMPTKGTYLKNTVGSAYGPVFDDSKQVIICLPGPPRELQAMVKDELVPYLGDRFGIRKIGASLQMRFVGIGESNIDETIQKKMTIPKDLMMEFKFDMGRVDVTFSLPHDTGDDKQTLRKLETDLLSHINEFFYGDDGSTLEEHVLQLLHKQNHTIAVAEVGSGGAIAASLGDSSNSDGVYLGGFVAPKHENLLKLVNQDNLLSHEINEESTIELAKRICRMIGSDWGIAVSEVMEDGDNRYVWVAMGSEKDGFQTERMSSGRGDSAQKRLVTNIINSLRKRINH
jgi:nicotinamide-nucleotide amidase